MKIFYSIAIALCIFNLVNVQAGELNSLELITDTIFKIISDFQSDSLIKANTASQK